MAANLSANFPDLNSMFAGGLSVFPASDAADRNAMAYQNQNINQAAALQDLFTQSQQDPLKTAEMGLRNQTLEAQLPGVQAQSDIFGQSAAKGKATLDSDIDASISKNATGMSKDQVTRLTEFGTMLGQLGAAAEQGIALPDLYSLPPELQKLVSQPGGGAKLREISNQISQHSNDLANKLQVETAKTDRATKVEGERTNRALKVAAARAQSTKEIADAKANAAAKGPKKLEEVAAGLLQKALETTDPEEKAMYVQMHDLAVKEAYDYNAGLRAAGATGKVDISGATQGQVPTIQTPTAPQLGKGGAGLGATPAAIKSQEEYNALPSGSLYIDQDGSTKRKK